MQLMADRPVISVCIPTLGREALVQRSVPSVLAETDLAVEVVVAVNGPGALPDDELLRDPRVTVVPGVEGSVGAVRNAAAAAASAPVLVFLDDDDEFLPGGLRDLSTPFDDPDVAFVSGRLESVDGAGMRTKVVEPEQLGALFADLYATQLAGGFAMRASLFDAVGGYDERLRFSENYELCMRLGRELARTGSRSVVTGTIVSRYWPSGRSYVDQSADCAEVILETHGELIDRDPKLKAQWEALAGVALFRAGRHRRGRTHLVRAARARPADWRNWYRLVLTLVPPLAKRVWGR